jgi:hypothetical protein
MATRKKAEQETAGQEKAAPEKAGQAKAGPEKAAKEKPVKEKAAAPEKTAPEPAPGGEEILQKAAKAIGSAIGTIAVKTGIAHAATPPKKKIPKLVKKNKQRLPRKAKKQAKKRLLAG